MKLEGKLDEGPCFSKKNKNKLKMHAEKESFIAARIEIETMKKRLNSFKFKL